MQPDWLHGWLHGRAGRQRVKTHITKNAVEELDPPASGYYIAFDDKLAGFGVRVTAAGVKSFVYDYRVGGRKRRYTIGRFGAEKWSVAEARNKVKELGPDIRSKGADPAGEKKARLAEPKMADLATDYIEQHAKAKKSDKSVYEDRRMLNNIILPKLGKLRVSDVSRRNVELLHNSLKETPYQANRVLSLLSKMFTFAMGDGMRLDNPAKGVERFPEDKRGDSWFNLDQLHAISDALDAYEEQDAADALRLLIVTGARPHEVIGATWPMFNLQLGVWTKPSHHTKERKTEHVPLSEVALSILRRMWEDRTGQFLFPGRDPGTARTTLRNSWRQVCKAAGLATVSYKKIGKRGKPLPRWKPSVRIYDLRHTFASHLVSRGLSLPVIGRLMGHTQPGTTARYAHVADSALRDATNNFPEILPPQKRLA
jgi:integrase